MPTLAFPHGRTLEHDFGSTVDVSRPVFAMKYFKPAPALGRGGVALRALRFGPIDYGRIFGEVTHSGVLRDTVEVAGGTVRVWDGKDPGGVPAVAVSYSAGGWETADRNHAGKVSSAPGVSHVLQLSRRPEASGVDRERAPNASMRL